MRRDEHTHRVRREALQGDEEAIHALLQLRARQGLAGVGDHLLGLLLGSQRARFYWSRFDHRLQGSVRVAEGPIMWQLRIWVSWRRYLAFSCPDRALGWMLVRALLLRSEEVGATVEKFGKFPTQRIEL